MRPLYRFGYVLTAALLKILFQFRVYGPKNLPRGKVIVAANHQSYIDPPAIAASIPEEIWYLAREDALRFAPLRWLCLKLNAILIRKRHADRLALMCLLEKLAEDRKVLIFPEGTRSYDGRLQTPEPGISLLAHRSGAPVVPAYVSGTFRVLPRGGATIHFHPVSVSFGQPLRFDELSLREGVRRAYETFSQQVMDAIARLKAAGQRRPAPKPSRRSSRHRN